MFFVCASNENSLKLNFKCCNFNLIKRAVFEWGGGAGHVFCAAEKHQLGPLTLCGVCVCAYNVLPHLIKLSGNICRQTGDLLQTTPKMALNKYIYATFGREYPSVRLCTSSARCFCLSEYIFCLEKISHIYSPYTICIFLGPVNESRVCVEFA